MPCRIELQELVLPLHIGCTEEERRHSQPMGLRAAVTSVEKFPACRTDRLGDTVDAALIKATVVETALATRVHTLECLGETLEERLRAAFPQRGLHWEITINKPRFGWSYVHAWTS